MSLNATTKTVQDVATHVRRQFGDESGVQVTDPDVIRWVNDGQREIAVKNKVIKGKATLNATALTADYTLPDVSIASIESIQWNGVPLRGLPYVEAEEEIKAYPSSASQQGTPLVWYEWGSTLSFWPTPSNSLDTITILYIAQPPAVESLGTTLSIPDKYYNALLEYVLSKAYEMDEDWDAMNFKNQQFNAALDSSAEESGLVYPVINDVVDY